MTKGYLTDDQYKMAYSLVPRACIDLLITRGPGLLLVRREQPPHVGLWHLPGGRIRLRESLAHAASRIAKDELGQDISPQRTVGSMEFLNDAGELGNFHSVSIVISAVIYSGAWRLNDNIDWFSSIPADTHPEHKRFLISNGWPEGDREHPLKE